MSKKLFVIVSLLLVVAMLAACQPAAAPAPAQGSGLTLLCGTLPGRVPRRRGHGERSKVRS